MSALGHKRTLKRQHAISALPPKADIAKRCEMSALCQERTLKRLHPMSAIRPKADIAERERHIGFVPVRPRPRSRVNTWTVPGGPSTEAFKLTLLIVAPLLLKVLKVAAARITRQLAQCLLH